MKKIPVCLSCALITGFFLYVHNTRESTGLIRSAAMKEAQDIVIHAPRAEISEAAAETQPGAQLGIQPASQGGGGKVPDMKPISAFHEWTKQYLAAPPEKRAAIAAQGAALAKTRRSEYQKLIRINPRQALELTVRPVVRQELPAEVVAELETPVSARGDYKVYFGRPQEGVELPADQELVMRYFETPQGKSYKAHVFGSMEEQTTRKGVALRGVAVDRELAVAESPVRQLEAGERIAAGTAVDETCPVSGEATKTEVADGLTVSDETPVVELAGRLIRLCDGTHVHIFEESQRMASGGPGGAGYFQDNYPGTSSEAIGNFRCLYIRVTYSDQMRAPNSEATAYGDMRNVSRYYLESSYGRLTTTPVVTPLIVLPHTKAWYIAKDSEVDGLGLVHSDSRSEARKLGFDSGQFNCTIVRVNEGPRLSGVSWGGGDSVWVSWDGMDVLDHECGHSLGRNHANFWETSDGSAIGVGSNKEYGNSFDVMGGGGGFGAHYNSYSKRSLGWLSDSYVHRPGTTPASNGVYRIYAYDQPQLEEGKRYSFRVDKDPQRRFYLEYHPAAGGQWTDSILMLLGGLGSNAGHLIDTTPGSAGGKGDGGIRVGRTFSDFESDLHFTVLSKNATTPVSMDVAMMRGPFPGNLPPAATFTATATSIPVNGTATFTATTSDPNGDALAYHWDFSDRYVTTNSPVITRSFPTADQQTVELTVSDMKGGGVRRNMIITIGSPGRAVVRGRITAGGAPLQGVMVTCNNATSGSPSIKYCFTDANGDFALADLSAGSKTLEATLTGYTFTAGFTNPVTTAANATVSGADWTAASVPEVSLTASNAAEGGPSGSFVLTRTGSTSAPLAVTVAPASGQATKTTDYSFSPDYTASGSLDTFTIPAGQASLTVTVAAVNDTAQEGPETVELQLAAGAGYQVRSGGVAILTIADDDTTKPVVSIEATDFYASETAGDAGTFAVRRTGSTAAALVVAVTYSGTATRGADYPNLPSTVTIPAGQSSVPINLVATDDAAMEAPEDATVTVPANAAYIVDATAAAATVTISDNDLPIVSVTAIDDTLNEAGRGTGTVVITRTGDLSQSLKVYYGVSGRALYGTDYIALPGEITLAAGMASAPVILTPYDDGHGEVDESITFNLTLFNNTYTLGPNFSAALNIKDDADPPLITVSANSAAEPATNGTFTFTATGTVAGNITVNYSLGGTASSDADYTAPSGSVVIAATGTNTATVTIPVINDALPENTETVILTVSPDPAYTVYNDGTAVMRLKDDDSEPVSVSTHSDALAEPSSGSSFYLSRSGTTGALTIHYSISGTATNGADYQTISSSAVIPDGASGVDIPVVPINDALAEGTESVILTLAPGAGYGIEVPSAKLYLADDDQSAMASVGFLSATGSTSETPDAATGEYRNIEVTLSAPQAGTVTAEYFAGGGSAFGDDVDWAFVDAANGNAVIPRSVVTFPPGSTSQFLRIRVKNDGVLEGPETAILELRNVIGARISTSRNKHTLSIADNNAANPVPRAGFLVSTTTRNETDGTEPLLIAALDAPSASAVSVNYMVAGTATAGADYTLSAGTVSFAPGEMAKKLPLVILPDGVAEPAETIVVTLSSPAGAQLGSIVTHTVTLTDDNSPVIAVAASNPEIAEDSGTGVFTISRIGGSSSLAVTAHYTMGGTAISGTDYAPLSGSAVIPANESSVSVSVVPVIDATEEPDKTVILTLTADPNYEIGLSHEATETILDDDAAPVITLVTPAVSAVSIHSGVGLMAEVTATRETPGGSFQMPVTWSQVSGPGIASFENPDNRLTGVTFSASGNYVIRASSTHGTTTNSDISIAVGIPLISGQDVGATTAQGSVTQSGGTWTLTGAGAGLSATGTADGFYFVSAPRTGDFDLKCRVVSFTNPGGNAGSCRFGIMVRADATPGAPYAMSLYKASGTHNYNYRLAADTATDASQGTTNYTMPRWVRIVRAGNNFSAFHGTDGITWTQRGATQSIPNMGTTPLAGLAITSAVAATASTAVFDSMNFTPLGNTGPFVDAGAALSGAGPFNLDATVSDDSQPVPVTLTTQWTARSGPGVVTFGNAGLVDTTASLSLNGLYTLRLAAADGLVTTYDDTTINYSAPIPIETWRAAKFAPDAGNPLIAGDLVDFDGDGIANLVEYALNSDPKASVAADLPFSTTDGTTLSLTYRKNLAATDVTVSLESSADMSTWSPAAATLETLSDDGQTRVIRASMPATDQRSFLRLLVTH